MTATIEIDPHGGLFGRRSVVGGAVILAVLCFFGLGWQAIDDALRQSEGFEVGQAVQVTDLVAFTPADGWVLNPDQSFAGLAVVADKAGWQMKLAGGLVLPPDQTLEEFAKLFHDSPPADPGAEVSEIRSFTTTSGLPGLTWEVLGTTSSSSTWLVANGADVAQMLGGGPTGSADALEPELQQMAESITIGAP